jgi:hypothetical protein
LDCSPVLIAVLVGIGLVLTPFVSILLIFCLGHNSAAFGYFRRVVGDTDFVVKELAPDISDNSG